MRRFLSLIAVVAVLAAGCSSASQQVVGVWKGEIIPPDDKSSSKDSKDIGEAFASGIKGLISGFIGPLTLEFNADGKYKASVKFGSTTGTYTVSGNDITLTPDPKDDNKTKLNLGKMEISSDGKTLRTRKEFQSDSVIELKKQP